MNVVDIFDRVVEQAKFMITRPCACDVGLGVYEKCELCHGTGTAIPTPPLLWNMVASLSLGEMAGLRSLGRFGEIIDLLDLVHSYRTQVIGWMAEKDPENTQKLVGESIRTAFAAHESCSSRSKFTGPTGQLSEDDLRELLGEDAP